MRIGRFVLPQGRWPLVTLAILFAAASVLYSGIWMYHVRVQPTAALGIDYEYIGPASGILITSVGRGTPADDLTLLVARCRAGDATRS
jgi:hypothetical protein